MLSYICDFMAISGIFSWRLFSFMCSRIIWDGRCSDQSDRGGDDECFGWELPSCRVVVFLSGIGSGIGSGLSLLGVSVLVALCNFLTLTV